MIPVGQRGSGQPGVEIVENPVRQTVAKGLGRICRLTRREVSSVEVLAGEPVFRGTLIEVKHVADLVRQRRSRNRDQRGFPGPKR